jgi:hypothetical protein
MFFLPYINLKATATSVGAATMELRPSLRDSMIRNTTIDRFPNDKDKKSIPAIRFTSQHIDRHRDGHTVATQVLQARHGGFSVVYKGMSAPQYGLDIAVKVVHEHMENKVTEQ